MCRGFCPTKQQAVHHTGFKQFCKLLKITVLGPRMFGVSLPALNENKLSYDYNVIWLLVQKI